MKLRRLVPQVILDNYVQKRLRGRLQAATMFIDVSGFSALSDALMPHGRQGIEVLTDVINRTFAPIVGHVYEHGGFISTFAGDAFTALFPLNREDAIPRAVVAAFGIQDIMAGQRHLYTRLGTFSLAIKVGLDVGPVDWGILGQEQAHTFYFRGPAIDGCAQAEAHARAGQIIASPALWARVSDHVRVDSLEGAYRLRDHDFHVQPHSPLLPSLDEDLLALFVSPSILHLPVSAEFRDVCSVFISFQAPPTPEELDAFVTRVMALVHIYGGYFNKIDSGDKGNVLLLLFGAPIAYENNVARAIEFLLALRQHPTSFAWRAGVTFGTAYAGFVGGQDRCEYTAIGDVVNLSSRLMTLARWDRILTDERVHGQLQKGYRFRSLGRHKVKGKRKPIPVYRLLERAPQVVAAGEQRPIFGRDKELAQLQTWLSSLWEEPPRARLSSTCVATREKARRDFCRRCVPGWKSSTRYNGFTAPQANSYASLCILSSTHCAGFSTSPPNALPRKTGPRSSAHGHVSCGTCRKGDSRTASARNWSALLPCWPRSWTCTGKILSTNNWSPNCVSKIRSWPSSIW